MWLNGTGQIAVAVRSRTTRPTARFVAWNGVCNRGRISVSIRSNSGMVLAVHRPKCRAGMDRAARNPGRVTLSRPSIIWAAGNASRRPVNVAIPGTSPRSPRMRISRPNDRCSSRPISQAKHTCSGGNSLSNCASRTDVGTRGCIVRFALACSASVLVSDPCSPHISSTDNNSSN
jgi:hypothetical protein